MALDRVPFAALDRESAVPAGGLRELRGFEAVRAAFCGTTQCVEMASGIAALTVMPRAAAVPREA